MVLEITLGSGGLGSFLGMGIWVWAVRDGRLGSEEGCPSEVSRRI